MRIIDKNRDFYDYMQDVYADDCVIFDRRDSYDLSKDEFASRFYTEIYKYGKTTYEQNQNIVLLQAGHSFWMFVLYIRDTDGYGRCENYDLELLDHWKDYDVKGEIIKLSCPTLYFTTWNPRRDSLKDPKILMNVRSALHQRDIRSEYTFNNFYIWKGKTDREIRTIPILKNIGIAAFIDPLEIYLAIDEYLSREKTLNERCDSIGITDREKIINHGFDNKTSFRGKNNE